jgi:hypothetical protein
MSSIRDFPPYQPETNQVNLQTLFLTSYKIYQQWLGEQHISEGQGGKKSLQKVRRHDDAFALVSEPATLHGLHPLVKSS